MVLVRHHGGVRIGSGNLRRRWAGSQQGPSPRDVRSRLLHWRRSEDRLRGSRGLHRVIHLSGSDFMVHPYGAWLVA